MDPLCVPTRELLSNQVSLEPPCVGGKLLWNSRPRQCANPCPILSVILVPLGSLALSFPVSLQQKQTLTSAIPEWRKVEGPGPSFIPPGVHTGASQEPDCNASHTSSLNPMEYWSHLSHQSTYCTAKSSSCGDTSTARQTDQHCFCL